VDITLSVVTFQAHKVYEHCNHYPSCLRWYPVAVSSTPFLFITHHAVDWTDNVRPVVTGSCDMQLGCIWPQRSLTKAQEEEKEEDRQSTDVHRVSVCPRAWPGRAGQGGYLSGGRRLRSGRNWRRCELQCHCGQRRHFVLRRSVACSDWCRCCCCCCHSLSWTSDEWWRFACCWLTKAARLYHSIHRDNLRPFNVKWKNAISLKQQCPDPEYKLGSPMMPVDHSH